MGKWTDKLYITHGEWKSGEFQGGLSTVQKHEIANQRDFKRLPFDHCALSLQPFTVPVMSPEGVVFDFDEIDRFIQLYSDDLGVCKCPITGKDLRFTDLLPLKFYKNLAMEYCCPVTGRVFSDATKIMVNLKSGQVYSGEAVEQMCTSGIDFCSNMPCTRADLIPIVDPGMVRNVADRFQSIQSSIPDSTTSTNLNQNNNTSTGRLAASLTSTAVSLVLKQELQPTKAIPKPLRNAQVVLKTTFGELEATLFAPMMPISVYNFIQRSLSGDYCQTLLCFVGSVAVQTIGNCTSPLPCKVKEKPHKNIHHSSPGMIGMCSDSDGSTSQFYITLEEAPELDSTSRVFGKLDLNNPNTKHHFNKIKECERDGEGRPLEYLAVLDVVVMGDPFTKDDNERLKKATLSGTAVKKPTSTTSVGKYLNL